MASYCFVSFPQYPPKIIKEEDKEKLGTKAVREEFHAEQINGTWVHKRLYGWNTLHTNVWLPSLSELVGIHPNNYNEFKGVYSPAMQGLNFSNGMLIDVKGGDQWAWITPRNASGGGALLAALCANNTAWTRSPDYNQATNSYAIGSNNDLQYLNPDEAHAVHPAVERHRQIIPSAGATCTRIFPHSLTIY